MVLVPKVAANMVNANFASAICLTALRSALRDNRSAKAHGPRNIANAHLDNDWPTLREARRVQKLIVCSRPLAKTRMHASAAPHKCMLPSPVHSNTACSHLTRRPPNCRNLPTKKQQNRMQMWPQIWNQNVSPVQGLKVVPSFFYIGNVILCAGSDKNMSPKTGTAFGTQHGNII